MMTEMTAEPVSDPYLDRILTSLRARSEVAVASLIELRVGPFWTVVQTSLGAGMA
jgi:hypothetical protein